MVGKTAGTPKKQFSIVWFQNEQNDSYRKKTLKRRNEKTQKY